MKLSAIISLLAVTSSFGAGLVGGTLSPPGSGGGSTNAGSATNIVNGGGGSYNNFTNTVLWTTTNRAANIEITNTPFTGNGSASTVLEFTGLSATNAPGLNWAVTPGSASGNYAHIYVDPLHAGGPASPDGSELIILAAGNIAISPSSGGTARHMQYGGAGASYWTYYSFSGLFIGVNGTDYSGLNTARTRWNSNGVTLYEHFPGYFARWSQSNMLQWEMNWFIDNPNQDNWVTNDLIVSHRQFAGTNASLALYWGEQLIGATVGTETNILSVTGSNGIVMQGKVTTISNTIITVGQPATGTTTGTLVVSNETSGNLRPAFRAISANGTAIASYGNGGVGNNASMQSDNITVSNMSVGLIAPSSGNYSNQMALTVTRPMLVRSNIVFGVLPTAPALATLLATNIPFEWYSNSVPPVKFAHYYDTSGALQLLWHLP